MILCPNIFVCCFTSVVLPCRWTWKIECDIDRHLWMYDSVVLVRNSLNNWPTFQQYLSVLIWLTFSGRSKCIWYKMWSLSALGFQRHLLSALIFSTEDIILKSLTPTRRQFPSVPRNNKGLYAASETPSFPPWNHLEWLALWNWQEALSFAEENN